jgi:signal transduction histidine kinase
MRQTVGLLASELVSNAVRHAGADSVAIRFQVVPTHIRVEVADDGPGFDVATRRVGQPGRAGGWGLRLVDELASRWGVADGERHTVWFEIDRV